jgi:dihydrolipoamide dehydrogenase
MSGYVASIRAAQLGLRTAVVERQAALGGTCLNWGCIPTKALLEHAHALKIARHAGEWGIDLPAGALPSINMRRVQARKDAIVSGLVRGIEYLLRKNRIDWIKGSACLRGDGRVDVTGADAASLAAHEIIVATGSAPRALPGVAIDHQRVMTSDDAIGLAEVPASLAIIGSGAVGVEFASIFRAFGTAVTLLEVQPRIVPSEDAAVSAELDKAFRKRGIEVRTSVEVTGISATDAGMTIGIATGGVNESLVVDRVLIATGRGPVTDGLGIDALGMTLDRGFIVVDEMYRTSVPGVAAIGDVITVGGRPHAQLAHLASAEGILAVERIAGRHVTPLNYDHVPACTFCDPEIGSVGLTEVEARERGYDVRIGSFPFSALGRARIAGETDGFVKIVADAAYDQLLGVHIIGPRATELVAEAAAALAMEATAEELVRTIHAHPTLAEAISEAAHGLLGGTINL